MIYSLPLKNGVRLLAEPAEQALSAAIGFWFPYGSRDESVRGAAHFIEHMLFKGTDEHSPFELAAEFDRSGGYINAFTEHETVCLHCLVPASYAERALKLLCEAAARSIFDPREFEKERSVIASEIVAALDDPEEHAHDAFFKAAYPRSPLSRPIAGT